MASRWILYHENLGVFLDENLGWSFKKPQVDRAVTFSSQCMVLSIIGPLSLEDDKLHLIPVDGDIVEFGNLRKLFASKKMCLATKRVKWAAQRA